MPSSSASKRIEEIDPNFAAKSVTTDSLRWFDAFDRTALALRGLAWPEENYATRTFRRLPTRSEGAMSEGVSVLSWCPASVFLAFSTDSPSLSVKVRVSEEGGKMVHMPLTGNSGVELYLKEGRRWLPVATGIPEDLNPDCQRQLFAGLPAYRREFRLYLPPYRRLEQLELGVDSDASITPSPLAAGEKPIFIYGTSITQGGCANTAGSDYVSLLGRLIDAEVVNFGFSGSGRAEPEVAELIAEVDAEMFVLDFAPNCPEEQMVTRLPRFVEILREKRPGVPIVLITHPGYNGTLVNLERFQSVRARRDIMLSFYSRQREAGDENIHLIDGFGLAPSGVAGTYVDGVHPTSGGFVQMAERIAPQLAAIRLWQKEWLHE